MKEKNIDENRQEKEEIGESTRQRPRETLIWTIGRDHDEGEKADGKKRRNKRS